MEKQRDNYMTKFVESDGIPVTIDGFSVNWVFYCFLFLGVICAHNILPKNYKSVTKQYNLKTN